MSAGQKTQLVVFDFDWADCLRKLNERGRTKQEIIAAFSTLPLHPAMKRAIENLSRHKEVDTTFLILSNSNSEFIDIVLSHHQLDKAIFKEIITNPAKWNSQTGLLELDRRVPKDSATQHQCQFGCSPNMCKGEELSAFLERMGGRDTFDRISYIGDGGNDYCPILRLKASDNALVRKGMELAGRIKNEAAEGNGSRLHCKVLPWEGAWEVEQIFQSNLSS